jgi:arylsulfatase
MTRRTWLGLLASVATVTVASAPVAAQQTQKPNVVFILADNVGYGDLGPYGGGELRGAPTSNIDQLAREGLRLTQFLVEPACTPSRAALMAGQYSIRIKASVMPVLVATTPTRLRDGTRRGHPRKT